jgi:hypothetical protein
MRASLPICLSVLLIACAAPSPNPHVVHPKLGETLTSVPGPLPNFGPFASVAEAILAACPVIMRQPHALIPVPRTDQNFSVYWRAASEYCAWLYSVDGEHVDMSLMATSPVQDDPSKRRCDLPAQVADGRHPEATMAYLVMLHNHAAGESLSLNDLYAIADMARIHGITTRFRGQQTSMSIVAFIGRERGGQPECAGFYHYVPARSDEILRYTVDNERLTKKVVARVAWSDEGNPSILPIEERP